jgi:hypothetical protein
MHLLLVMTGSLNDAPVNARPPLPSAIQPTEADDHPVGMRSVETGEADVVVVSVTVVAAFAVGVGASTVAIVLVDETMGVVVIATKLVVSGATPETTFSAFCKQALICTVSQLLTFISGPAFGVLINFSHAPC